MKFKSIKYIVLYFLSLFFAIFLYSHAWYIKSFIQDNSKYRKISKMKSEKAIWFWDYWLSWLNLDSMDAYNVNLLGKSLTWAISKLLNNKEYSYKDFYNLWNLYLLKSFSWFNNNNSSSWSWYVESAQKAISYYYSAIDTSPPQNNKSHILNNLNIAKSFLSVLYAYDCNNVFLDMLNKLKSLISIIPYTVETLKNQYLALERFSQYEDLKECVKIFQNSSQTNASLLLQNQDFFKKIQKSINSKWKELSRDENLCYQQIPLLREKYQNSISLSLLYFQDFDKKQKSLLKVFKNWDAKHMKDLCDNLDKLEENQNKKNNDIIQNLNNLQDLLDQETQKKEKNKDKSKQKTEDKDWWASENSWENWKYSQKLEELKRQNTDIIKQIQRLKTNPDYKPMKYIEELFKEFYWNKRDFIHWQRQNSSWK